MDILCAVLDLVIYRSFAKHNMEQFVPVKLEGASSSVSKFVFSCALTTDTKVVYERTSYCQLLVEVSPCISALKKQQQYTQTPLRHLVPTYVWFRGV